MSGRIADFSSHAVHARSQDTNRFITRELPGILRDSHGLLLERQPSDAVRMEQCHTTTEKVTLIVGEHGVVHAYLLTDVTEPQTVLHHFSKRESLALKQHTYVSV